MSQKGAENGKARYHCSFCGNTTYVDISVNDNAEYWDKRSALLGRVRLGIMEWKTGESYYLVLLFDGYELKELARLNVTGDYEAMRGVYIDGYFYAFGQNGYAVESILN